MPAGSPPNGHLDGLQVQGIAPLTIMESMQVREAIIGKISFCLGKGGGGHTKIKTF